MFLELIKYLSALDPSFSVISYLTLRAVLAMLAAMFVVLVFGKLFIDKLYLMQIGQVVRSDGPETHLKKSGTPTMGGILILFGFILSVLIWGDLSSIYLWIVITTAIVIGAWILLADLNPLQTELVVPFLKDYYISIGSIGFMIVSYFAIVGSSNAVNLTDGLDGLAIMPVILISGGLAVFAYIHGNVNFSSYLNMPYMVGTGEIFVICAALAGAGLGFLWHNTYPADVFMGDVGSLSIGAILAVIAIILREEILLIVMGGVFVAETLSVMIQVGYYKRTQKRIFLMAPLHHHFEKMGMSEPKIIVRFWMVTLMLVLISLATIKIR